eukprot:5374838-Ditylum_brightwellii.AAC.1
MGLYGNLYSLECNMHQLSLLVLVMVLVLEMRDCFEVLVLELVLVTELCWGGQQSESVLHDYQHKIQDPGAGGIIQAWPQDHQLELQWELEILLVQ